MHDTGMHFCPQYNTGHRYPHGAYVHDVLSHCMRRRVSYALHATLPYPRPCVFECFAVPSHTVLPAIRYACRLAVLEACSSFPPTALTLVFGIPHTTAISKAVAACCPHLSELVLDYVHNDLPGEGASDTEEYAAGVVSLLREAGPRLRKLQVENCNAQGWPPEGMSALQCCTALTSLCFTAEPGAGEMRRCTVQCSCRLL